MRRVWRKVLVVTFSGIANAPVLAATHIIDIAWKPDGSFVHEATVAPGKFIEVCGKLNPGEVRWRFEASAPLDFNIHYHVGKETAYPAKQSKVRSGQDTLRVAVDEDYCWMWSNKSAEGIKLDVRLQR